MNLCVIPARGGSKRIHRKNLRPFCGKPMIIWSIEAAQNSGLFARIIVSTDDAEIASTARAAGAEVPFSRPAQLSDDATPTVPVIVHALAEAEALWGRQSHICCLYATAPFVCPADIREARALLDTTKADYAFPVTTFAFPVQRGVRLRPDGRLEMLHPEHALTRSQDLEEAYHDTGQFYWGRRDAWLSGKPLMGPDAVPLIIPRIRAQDIDTPEDWDRAERMFTLLRQTRQRLVIRADASLDLGVGHVMRCLALAEELGGDACFVCKGHPGHLGALIGARGHRVQYLDPAISDAEDAEATSRLAATADLVIVDHYGLDAAWEREMPCPVMVIDDLADRPHACRILLDQNLGRRAADYDGLLPDRCQRLIGTGFALLRPEFAARRAAALEARAKRHGAVRSLLITMGGTDATDATGWVLDQLAQMDLPSDLSVTVVLGATAPHAQSARARLSALPCRSDLLIGTDRMACLMAGADLCIGAAGSTSWERCALGLPTVMLVLADNQRASADHLCHAQAAVPCDLDDGAQLRGRVRSLLSDPAALSAMTQAAAGLVDGLGAVRVADAIRQELKEGIHGHP